VWFAESGVPASFREQAARIQEQAWPTAPDRPTDDNGGHDPALHPITMLPLDEDGTVLAVLDILR
jgi:hypothetical protein